MWAGGLSRLRLTNIVDVAAGGGSGGGGAEGQLVVSGGLHLHVAALRVLAGQARRVADGGVRVLAVQRARAGGAQARLHVVYRETHTVCMWVCVRV